MEGGGVRYGVLSLTFKFGSYFGHHAEFHSHMTIPFGRNKEKERNKRENIVDNGNYFLPIHGCWQSIHFAWINVTVCK
jgi:hypothetical protein